MSTAQYKIVPIMGFCLKKVKSLCGKRTWCAKAFR